MPSARIVEAIDVLEQRQFAFPPDVYQGCRQISSAFTVLKKVSTAALSEQFPLPLIDTWTPYWRRSF